MKEKQYISQCIRLNDSGEKSLTRLSTSHDSISLISVVVPDPEILIPGYA